MHARSLRRPWCGARLALPALVLTAGFLAGCGDDPSPLEGAGRDLLTDGPDGWTVQFGALEPDPGAQWGDAGPMGWANETRTAPFQDHVLTSGHFAHLDLQTATPRTRELEIEAWIWEDAPLDRCELRVHLNNVLVGTADLGKEPSEIRIEAPEQVWIAGSNIARLELVPTEEDALTKAELKTLRLAVARVAYDSDSEVELDGETIELEPDTAVRWAVIPRSDATLVLRGEAGGSGELQVLAQPIQMLDGSLGSPLYDSTIAARKGEIARGIALEASNTPIQIELRWKNSESRFDLGEVRLVESDPSASPPILFLAIDTLSAHNLSLYGYERDTAPNLEALAADAVVFERAITNAPWTLPSFMSVMTGVFPYSHRQDASSTGSSGSDIDLWEMWYLTDNRWALAEELRARGYDTAGFVDNLWITERFGFPQGFELYDSSAGDIDKLDNSGGIRHVSKLAKEWLADRRSDSPFFLFLHCFDVHGPYSPEEPFRGRYREDDLQLSEGEAWGDGVHNCYGVVPAYITTGEWEPDATPARVPTGRIHDSYDEGIRMTDADVGKLFEHLKSIGLYDELLIVVFSDHGETMGEGPYYFGHGVMDDTVLRVPLIFKFPQGQHAGTRVSEPVQLVDVYPTVLDILGVEPEQRGLHGRSLLPLIEGGEGGATLYSEGGICDHRAVEKDGWKLIESRPGIGSPAALLTHPLTLRMLSGELDEVLIANGVKPKQIQALREYAELTKVFTIIGERGYTPEVESSIREITGYKELMGYLRRAMRGPFYSLHDIAADPEHRTDLAAEQPEKLAELKAELERMVARKDEAQQRGRFPTEPVALSAEDLAELEKLGYGGGASEE